MTYWQAVAGIIKILVGTASPIFFGLIVAYILNIPMSVYEKHFFKGKIGKLSRKKKKHETENKTETSVSDKPTFAEKAKRPVCLTASILTLVGIVALVVGIVLPELASCVTFLVSEIPDLIKDVLNSEIVERVLSPELINELESIDWKSYLTKIAETLGSGLGNAVDVVFSAISSVVSAVVSVFIGFIFAVYMLFNKEHLLFQSKRILTSYVKPRWVKKLLHLFDVLNDSFRKYIVGQCTEAVILGILCIIGMVIFRFPYSMMVGTLVGFTALIPIAGAYIGAIVGALMILTVSPIKAVFFIVFIIVLQQLEGNIIYPKVVGSSLGLPSLWVLAAVTVGGGIMGITGMLLGVPLAAALYRLLHEDLDRKDLLKERNCGE